ncbi:MAG TPA: methyltransferase domain-containing protein [Jiangellales bacterium]|nr:methyltransferase domain-containing protein [Jiangellales bacterium]
MSEVFDPGWLALREPADHAARSAGATALLPPLVERLPATRPVRVLDLGCGIGSNVRWLAPRLPAPQHWVLVDHDPALLDHAVASLQGWSEVLLSVTGHPLSLSDLRSSDLADIDLVTGSALLDVLTGPELEHLVAVSASAGTPVLLALSVDGRVTLEPPLPEDAGLRVAFDAHQRRERDGAHQLGSEAARHARRLLRRYGYDVRGAATPWSLGPTHAALAMTWYDGWAAAAAEERPDLAEGAVRARTVRRRQAARGELRVQVGHVDLLALPSRGS